MSRANVELDFFGIEKDSLLSSSKSQFQKFLHRQRSFRGMQSAISKINPEVLKSVISSASATQGSKTGSTSSFRNSVLVPSSPALPLYTPALRPSTPETQRENSPVTTPLTIFYNGTVAVFDVPRDKAKNILKLALEGKLDPKVAVPSSDQQQLLHTLNQDLPIARRKSLQRFLQKRKERLTCASPYAACFT